MSNKRLIDANALLDQNNWSIKQYSEEEADAWRDGIALMKKNIKNAPTIDPESLRPVAHWEESVCFNDAFWVCSNCKFPSEAIAAPRLYHYCPNCGAKMEE